MDVQGFYGPKIYQGKKALDSWQDDTIMMCAQRILVSNKEKLCEKKSKERALF